MSRSRILPSSSSSRQMMIAWKVSGDSQRPAIIVSRPASMRLAMAISPSRDSSSTEPISRRYMRTGSSVRSVGSLAVLVATAVVGRSATSVPSSFSSSSASSASSDLVGLDDVDAHLVEHRHDVLDLLGRGGVRGEDLVELVDGDIAALLRGLDHLLDGGIGKVEQRPVGGLRRGFRRLFVFLHLGRHALLRTGQKRRPASGVRPKPLKTFPNPSRRALSPAGRRGAEPNYTVLSHA